MQLPHPPRCWICENVVAPGVGEGVGVGGTGGVGEARGVGEAVGLGEGEPEGVKAALDNVPLPHPLARIENNKAILRTTDVFSNLSRFLLGIL